MVSKERNPVNIPMAGLSRARSLTLLEQRAPLVVKAFYQAPRRRDDRPDKPVSGLPELSIADILRILAVVAAFLAALKLGLPPIDPL